MAMDEHYRSYVAVDGRKLSRLPLRVNEVLAPVLAVPPESLLLPHRVAPTYGFEDEETFDLTSWLEELHHLNSVPTARLDAFVRWLQTELIIDGRWRRPEVSASPPGISLLVPDSASIWARYREYPLFRQSSLGALWAGKFDRELQQAARAGSSDS